jgi:hypothetical protein
MFTNINKAKLKMRNGFKPKSPSPDRSGNPFAFSFKKQKIAMDSGNSSKKKRKQLKKVISVSYYILKEAISTTRLN